MQSTRSRGSLEFQGGWQSMARFFLSNLLLALGAEVFVAPSLIYAQEVNVDISGGVDCGYTVDIDGD